MSQAKKATARVYTRSGVRITLNSVVGDPAAELRKTNGVIEGVDASSGDRVSIRTEEVVSVAVPPELAPDPQIFWGRRFDIRSAAGYLSDAHRATEAELMGTDEGLVVEMVGDHPQPGEVVVLQAEDLAGAIVVIYDLATDDALWVNPASSPDAIEYAIQALKLLALAETVENEFQQLESTKIDKASLEAEKEQFLGKMKPGRTVFETGDIRGALEWNAPGMAGQVERWLAARAFSGEVEVQLSGLLTGWTGVIVGYEEADPRHPSKSGGRFLVDLLGHQDDEEPSGKTQVATKVPIEEILRVTCWDIEDRRRKARDAGPSETAANWADRKAH